jgi:RNA polymerase sigma-70 factor (ECF subfamily)
LIRQLISRGTVSRLIDESAASATSDAAALFQAHADGVAGWASRLGGPLIDVEDVVQEVFVVVHRRLAKFRGNASVTTWLYGITMNVVRQQRRKAARRRWFGGRDETGEETAPQLTPIEEIERRRRALAVYSVLDAMGETNRTVLILSEIEGLKGEEIAQLTGTKIGTVWVRLHRARNEFSALARKLIPDEVASIEEARITIDSRTRSR